MLHLLYIDDDLIDRMTLQRLVKKNEHIYCTAVGSISEAVSALASTYFDCVLSDYNLPEGSINEVEAIVTGIPLMVVSGVAVPEQLVYPSFIKPITSDNLMEALFTLCKSEKVIFNLDYLHEIADGDAGFVNDILDIFRKEVPQELQHLKEAVITENWAQAAQYVHKLRSRVRILGLQHFKNLSDTLEPMLKAETDLVTAKRLARQFISGMECVVIQIAHNKTVVKSEH